MHSFYAWKSACIWDIIIFTFLLCFSVTLGQPSSSYCLSPIPQDFQNNKGHILNKRFIVCSIIELILYNVRVLDQFWPPVVPCYAIEDAFRIVNSFITIPITRNYIHSQLFLTLLHVYTAYIHLYIVTTITYSTLTRLHSLQTLHSNLYCTIAHKVS
jgi:hypothetical protein